MSIPTITPPKVTEVLPAVKNQVLNVASIITLLGGEHIYVAEGDSLAVPYPASSTLASGGIGRIVLIERDDYKKEYLDKSINYMFNVRVDFKAGSGDSPRVYIENVQEAIFELLQWKLLTMTKAKQIYNLYRQKRSVKVLYEKEENFYYSSSVWSILLTSTDN